MCPVFESPDMGYLGPLLCSHLREISWGCESLIWGSRSSFKFWSWTDSFPWISMNNTLSFLLAASLGHFSVTRGYHSSTPHGPDRWSKAWLFALLWASKNTFLWHSPSFKGSSDQVTYTQNDLLKNSSHLIFIKHWSNSPLYSQDPHTKHRDYPWGILLWVEIWGGTP